MPDLNSIKAPHISVVTPIYGCCEVIKELYQRLASTLLSITESYEIILVNDASPDNAWDVIQELARKDSRVKGINFSRNFGQHHAITAGLHFSKGDWIIVMDSDLQDQPEEIPKLYAKAMEGYDLVIGIRLRRQDTYLKKFFSKIFYRTISYFTDSKIDNRIGNYGVYSRKVIHNICKLKEQNRSLGLFALWVGFRRIEIPIQHARRPYGKSGYNFTRMLNLAISSIIAHSNKLLGLFVKIGFALACFSLIFAAWLVFRYFYWGIPVIGWTSLIVSIYLTAGLIISVIGIVGIYIGKIFDEVKGRPLYIIESTTFEMSPDND
ncbi:glycosyltransferase family 2 protein [Gimesia fumaroli]|uniref:Undecaprenyl-phosphate 4-deoxy-4-formamido-L-arabinose transferase n=1 Tax=Gimesia fumaroli TaxID=2527976 RepID=A0A518IDM7_9PLAN|nr:glycosyltransferase family 2 protein [Gimesia fumaroli]QDV51206.1 Undecaprenyl-phosphate 4-deoxy-4-formamido-L-arabinose transferase [Gimesia fumaroli]